MEGDPRENGRESGRKEQEKWDAAAYLFQTLLSVVPRKKKQKQKFSRVSTQYRYNNEIFIVAYKSREGQAHEPTGVTNALSSYQLSFCANLNILFHGMRRLGKPVEIKSIDITVFSRVLIVATAISTITDLHKRRFFQPLPSSFTGYKEVSECFVGLNEESLISCKVQTIKADKIHSAFSIDVIWIKILPLSTSCKNPSFPPIRASSQNVAGYYFWLYSSFFMQMAFRPPQTRDYCSFQQHRQTLSFQLTKGIMLPLLLTTQLPMPML